jgi:hypothetical protein
MNRRPSVSEPTKEEIARDLNLELDCIARAAIDGGYKPDKKKLEAIRRLVENMDKGPEVDEEWIKNQIKNYWDETEFVTEEVAENPKTLIYRLLKILHAAGVRVKEGK